MPAAQGAAHSLESVALAIALAATILVAYWRTVIKFVIMLFAVLVIAVVGAAAFTFIEVVHL